VVGQLRPHCHRAELAGSVRRGKDLIGDIEVVAIPKPYDIGLLKYGLPEVVDQWELVKGKLMPGKTKYTQRILPCGIKLDLFLVNESNFGYHYTIRTGSAAYSKWLAQRWVKKGFNGVGGNLTRDGEIVPVPSEKEFYRLLDLKWVAPRFRR
jgi:DNA polymerase (family 10)